MSNENSNSFNPTISEKVMPLARMIINNTGPSVDCDGGCTAYPSKITAMMRAAFNGGYSKGVSDTVAGKPIELVKQDMLTAHAEEVDTLIEDLYAIYCR